MIPLAAVALTGCLAVSAGADRILAGDIAAAIPGLFVPAADVPLALAPEPGVQRVFRVPELRRLAARLHWDLDPVDDVCFARPAAPPDPARLLGAMRNALPQAEIVVLDYRRQPVPEGEIEFPVNGLRAGAGGALWTGYVHYAGTRRLVLWARVQVRVTVSQWVAAVDLQPGRAIAPEQVRWETRQAFPPADPLLPSGVDAIGKWPRLPIHAGTAIRGEMLQNPKDVARGDKVLVEVRNGAARLAFEARAEGDGVVGETIPILNPASHKRFVARVEGKGRVSVALSVAKVNP